jgi:hypothetical protein
MNEVAKKAPDCPGVYVWYCYLCIGKADTQDDKSLLNLLNSYTEKFGRQQMAIAASLNFDQRWNGQILPHTISVNSIQITDENCLTKESREIIAEMLEESNPIFYQPLYIGKAERSLKTRLNQHVAEFLKLKEMITSASNINYQGEDDFAQRAVSLGYSEDQLVVHTLSLDDHKNISQDQIKKIISTVEAYLNKWSAPLLGRR